MNVLITLSWILDRNATYLGTSVNSRFRDRANEVVMVSQMDCELGLRIVNLD